MPAKKDENKKCPNCGACQECGHGGTQYVPYPVYPYYPWWSVTPYTQPVKWQTGQIGAGGSISASQTSPPMTYTSNASGNYTVQ